MYMEKEIKAVSAHADSNGMALITCPSCNVTKKLSVSQFKDKKHKLVTKCQCGERFEIHLNFRASYRKQVDLSGMFMLVSPRTSHWCEMEVSDLSRTGIGFRNAEMETVDVKKGDKLKIKFNLDNAKKTLIEKQVVVKIVIDQYVGCEFQDLALEEKELGFYLFS